MVYFYHHYELPAILRQASGGGDQNMPPPSSQPRPAAADVAAQTLRTSINNSNTSTSEGSPPGPSIGTTMGETNASGLTSDSNSEPESSRSSGVTNSEESRTNISMHHVPELLEQRHVVFNFHPGGGEHSSVSVSVNRTVSPMSAEAISDFNNEVSPALFAGSSALGNTTSESAQSVDISSSSSVRTSGVAEFHPSGSSNEDSNNVRFRGSTRPDQDGSSKFFYLFFGIL